MELFATPRVVVAGATSGAGKSTAVLGILLALRARGVSVSCFTTSPAFAQAVVLQRISRRPVRCLDAALLSPHALLGSLRHAGIGADVILGDGTAALYDGTTAGSLKGSDAEVAISTATPVVLVADAAAVGASIAAVVRGFRGAVDGCDVAGVIASRATDAAFLDAALASFGEQPLLGVVAPNGGPGVPPGGVRQGRNEASLPRSFFLELADAVASGVNLDALVAAAAAAPPLRLEGWSPPPVSRRTRIAVSDDLCFNLCFQDNLDLMRLAGAELVPFSPLADPKLPSKIGGLYVTGAYLDEYGEELSSNESMRRSVKEFCDSGGVVYSEGSGTAYLCRTYTDATGSRRLPGAGVVPTGAVRRHGAGGGYVYRDATSAEDTVLGPRGTLLHGIDTGEWAVENEAAVLRALHVSVRQSRPGVPGPSRPEEGYSPGAQILSTFSFYHLGACPEAARAFVDAAEVVAKI